MTKSKCIFCLESKNISNFSEEHIFPESLGNKDLILSKESSLVCEKCNNETLSKLDSHLSNHCSLKPLRALHGIKNKAGHTIEYRSANNISISKDQKGATHLTIPCKIKSPHKHTRPTRKLKFTIRTNQIKDSDTRLLLRALLKITYEVIALHESKEKILKDNSYTLLRDIVMGNNTDFNGYVGIKTIDHDQYCFYEDHTNPGVFSIKIHTVNYLFGILPKDFNKLELQHILNKNSFRALVC